MRPLTCILAVVIFPSPLPLSSASSSLPSLQRSYPSRKTSPPNFLLSDGSRGAACASNACSARNCTRSAQPVSRHESGEGDPAYLLRMLGLREGAITVVWVLTSGGGIRSVCRDGHAGEIREGRDRRAGVNGDVGDDGRSSGAAGQMLVAFGVGQWRRRAKRAVADGGTTL